MDEFETDRALSGKPDYVIGEDLYGVSVHELEARISAYTAEIERLRTELAKKSQEKNAADALFAPKGS